MWGLGRNIILNCHERRCKNMKEKISIIVPVYNSECYLERCLNSILNQTYKNLEVILVDDGSTDSSEDIISKYRNNENYNVKYIKTTHAGAGVARNIAYKHATGEYIAFVDADDYIHENMYEKMLEHAKKNQADIVICNVKLFNINGESIIQKSINGGLRNRKNYMQYGVNLCSPCNKLFKRELLENEMFETITFEDTALIPVIVSKAEKISFIDKHYYNYILRKGSTVSVEKFCVDDFLNAITYSLQRVSAQYYNELAYWHARCLLNALLGERYKYKERFVQYIKDNQKKWSNKLIKEDYFVRNILDIEVFLENEEFSEITDITSTTATTCKFTIITKSSSEKIEALLQKQDSMREDIQFLQDDPQKDITIRDIKGRYLMFLESVESISGFFLKDIYALAMLYSSRSTILAIPLSDNTQHLESKNSIITLTNMYIKTKPNDYLHIIERNILEKHSLSLSLTKQSLFGLALMHNTHIILANQFQCKEAVSDFNYTDIEECNYYIQSILYNTIQYAISFNLGAHKELQSFVMNEIKKICEKLQTTDFNTESTQVEIKNTVRLILEWIDDDVILNLQRLTPEHKMFFFRCKYGTEADIIAEDNIVNFAYNGQVVYAQDDTYTIYEFIDYENNILTLEGRTICLNCNLDEEVNILFQVNGAIYSANIIDRDCNREWLGEILYRGLEFQVSIPISSDVAHYDITMFYTYRNHIVSRRDIRFAKYAPLSKKFVNSYLKKDDRVLKYDDDLKGLTLHLCGRKGKFFLEKNFLQEIKEQYPRKYKEVYRLRIQYFLHTIFSRTKPIWLISDKAHRGDDNGEAFFKFLNRDKEARKKVKAYLIFDHHSPDYKRLQKEGRIVKFNSLKHKFLTMCCEYQFAAYVHTSIVNPLIDDIDFYKDILKRERVVFIQHGITQNDISSALHKYNQNFKAIISANMEEHNSFLEFKYFYREDQIKLLGFPRYDYLSNQPQKYITIAPTWRRTIFGDFIQSEERYVLNENYKESTYYKFYHTLLNSETLLKKAKAFGYELHIIPHPVCSYYKNIFDVPESIIQHGTEVSYNEMFAKSNLFITDYSSAVFDFAYMKKPVLYTLFDIEEFYSKQYSQGMFDYETGALGETAYTVEETIDLIIEYMENGCEMKPLYKERVDEFFAFHDKTNCKRIFDAFYQNNDSE